MITLYKGGAYYAKGEVIPDDAEAAGRLGALGETADKASARKNTIAYSILESHNVSGSMEELRLKADAMASHDITYVGIVQTARASGLDAFPIPYVLTNCHNTLCAVGGTINSDDHAFGLSAAMRYGGIYVPPHQAVIHQYMREMMSGGGKLIIGSDSHTRYGALGTMGIGEGGGELAKQLLGKTYDISMPDVVGVYLTGRPERGVGPQDVALAIIGAVFDNGYVKNKIMEFIGDGIKNLGVEYRNGIDVMTTETTCLSSIWETDGPVEQYYGAHGRKAEYKRLAPAGVAYYDGFIHVDLAKVKPMIAMPFHPANVYSIEEFYANPADIINEVEKNAAKQLDNSKLTFTLKDKLRGGGLYATQGVIAGCAGGTFDNVCDAADILRGHSIGNDEFALSVYPSSQPTFLTLIENGAAAALMTAGAVMRSAFCGPCFGAGDVPSNNGFSVRHTTRNFPNREGSRPSDGQTASVALMDARSIAATALNGGRVTAATELDVNFTKPKYYFNKTVYDNVVYDGYGKPDRSAKLRLGPGIADWPEMTALPENLLLGVAAFITDPVTTTDELIPSGETSSYRSNPLKLAEHTLSRKVPEYVGRAKAVQALELARRRGEDAAAHDAKLRAALERLGDLKPDMSATGIGSVVYAVKPGDGSAREQAASCQKVLGGWANIAREYATKRYRSNLINWGMVPFVMNSADTPEFECGDYIYVPGIRAAIENGDAQVKAYAAGSGGVKSFSLGIGGMTEDERRIILAGCLINYYR